MKKIALSFIILFICIAAYPQYSKGVTVETLLKTDTTSIGAKIQYPAFSNDEVTISKVTIPPGESTGWHLHEFPVFAYVLKGTLTVQFENNKTMQFNENSSFAEVVNTLHNGLNNGKEEVVLIAFYMGEKGKSLSILKKNPQLKPGNSK
jgi:quercetin dioxygenase-like cupin family protein